MKACEARGFNGEFAELVRLLTDKQCPFEMGNYDILCVGYTCTDVVPVGVIWCQLLECTCLDNVHPLW